ncbi:hypothetical protein P4O66_006544 [Electrophorus voltai]|uniref:Uncharacterized protein n=1 Tax=Electrophorus voltai TaxID=2609070 RepID=A0AAD9E0S0_9TELE|nr:hypothetical protein P4O66_006544 [Electrophorus voltai]
MVSLSSVFLHSLVPLLSFVFSARRLHSRPEIVTEYLTTLRECSGTASVRCIVLKHQQPSCHTMRDAGLLPEAELDYIKTLLSTLKDGKPLVLPPLMATPTTPLSAAQPVCASCVENTARPVAISGVVVATWLDPTPGVRDAADPDPVPVPGAREDAARPAPVPGVKEDTSHKLVREMPPGQIQFLFPVRMMPPGRIQRPLRETLSGRIRLPVREMPPVPTKSRSPTRETPFFLSLFPA